MADMLASGMAWLAEQMLSHAARTITYCRGANETSLNATIGRTMMKIDDGHGGVRIVWTDRDYLIGSSSLVIDGVQTVPQRGDVIRDASDGVTRVYRVASPSGEAEWRWSDPHRAMMRVHTVFVGEE